ncbi:MAG: cupin domain-containing protein [Alphaproteobacteria bacterium]|nr:cupin domain-containing protein [Alphaproteobacteria bacterium]
MAVGPTDRHDHDANDRYSARPATESELVSTESLAHIPGFNITVVRVTFPPGGFSPAHTHPGAVFVYVLSGRIASQLDGGPVGTYAAGQSFFEPPGAIHRFAENPSTTEPAVILAAFIAPPGARLIAYLRE